LRTLARVCGSLLPHAGPKLAMNALVNGTWNARAMRDRILEELGFTLQASLLMSPSMTL